MAQYKPGLHKDVVTIFNGVWNSQLDNIQGYVGSNGLPDETKVKPLIIEPQTIEAISSHEPDRLETPKQDLVLRLMPAQQRYERKRLKSISRYILAIK